MKMRQVKIEPGFGEVQVQITNSFFYLSVVNSIMQSVTLWATAGPSIQRVIPWASYWLFISLGAILVITVMVLDYKFMYPTRQAFLNTQACKHTNPAMELLWEMDKKLDELKESENKKSGEAKEGKKD